MNSLLAFLSSQTQYVLGSSCLPGTVLSISLVLSHMNPSDSVHLARFTDAEPDSTEVAAGSSSMLEARI